MSTQTLAQRLYWMSAIADGGYSQPHRQDVTRTRGITTPGFQFETDCSAMVLEAARQAGYPTGTATYTGDMRAGLEAVGWAVIPYAQTGGDADNLATGDLLLSESASGGVGHVAGYIGDERLAEAWIDGAGDIMGSAEGDGPGDDTGGETRVIGFYAHPYTQTGRWTHVLRPPALTGGDATTPTPTPTKGHTHMFTISYNSIYGIKGYALITDCAGAYALDRVGAQVYNDVLPMTEVPAHHAELLIREAWQRHNRVAATGAAETRVDIDDATEKILNAVKEGNAQ
jgi:hypothetical protein